ncbi:hypothetical protein K435DRAFT_804255 [Dendrothele bispora CBS 962.96]|uniref:Uncharacterized protein n=1 Tax=Dendrothele bispora (strain CBS 962.96) TaxID=1314807 RepID=A0A4S8LFN2_DENBC|nr:hypothetical protein K435DRAFT_804255 [Dendrothele bispora CBS 962.96]
MRPTTPPTTPPTIAPVLEEEEEELEESELVPEVMVEPGGMTEEVEVTRVKKKKWIEERGVDNTSVVLDEEEVSDEPELVADGAVEPLLLVLSPPLVEPGGGAWEESGGGGLVDEGGGCWEVDEGAAAELESVGVGASVEPKEVEGLEEEGEEGEGEEEEEREEEVRDWGVPDEAGGEGADDDGAGEVAGAVDDESLLLLLLLLIVQPSVWSLFFVTPQSEIESNKDNRQRQRKGEGGKAYVKLGTAASCPTPARGKGTEEETNETHWTCFARWSDRRYLGIDRLFSAALRVFFSCTNLEMTSTKRKPQSSKHPTAKLIILLGIFVPVHVEMHTPVLDYNEIYLMLELKGMLQVQLHDTRVLVTSDPKRKEKEGSKAVVKQDMFRVVE